MNSLNLTSTPSYTDITWRWLMAAAVLGLLVATQPLPLIGLGLAVVAVVVLGFISPLSTLILMLVLAPLRTLIATEGQFPLPLDIGQLAWIGLIAVWLMVQVARQNNIRLKTSILQLPLAAFILIIGLSAFNAASLGAWLNEWLKWVIIFLLISLSLEMGAGRKWQWLVFGLVIAAVANALVGLYIFFGGSGADHLLILGRYFRAFGTFGQPNPFGGFMGMVAPITIMSAYGHTMQTYHRWQRERHFTAQSTLLILFYGTASLVIIGGIFASWSRGAWLSLVVTCGMLAFALPRKFWQSLLLALSVVFVVGGMWFGGLLPESIVARVASSTEEFFAFDDVRGVDITTENYAVVERLAHWQAALNMVQHHPFLGVGMGNYEIVYDRYRLINWDEALGHAHNYYLNILAEAGMMGFLAYALLWLSMFWLTWRAREHPDPIARATAIGILGTWTYLSAHSMLDNLYVNNLFLHLGVMLGIIAVLYKQLWKTRKLRWT